MNHLAFFVIQAIQGDSNMNNLAHSIITEIIKIVNACSNHEAQGLKNISKFLILLSEKVPKTVYNNMSSLISLFDHEAYVIRNTLIDIIGNLIVELLCNTDEVSDVDVRNNYMKTKEKFTDILFDRIYDKNSFCRSKVLQVFEKLGENNTISVVNYLKLLKEASGRLKDEKSNVRKRAISLISRIIIIYSTIFKNDRFLNYEELNSLITDCNQKIQELEKLLDAKAEKIREIAKAFDPDVESTGMLFYILLTLPTHNLI